MSPILEKIIAAVREVSLLAGAPFATEQKGDVRNLVTSADRNIETFLRGKLSEILPEAAFFGEEENARATGPLFFVLDPIDGTTNFSRGNPYCCISVGLVRENRPVLGVVYAFPTDTLYYAEEGGGAYVNGRPLHVSDRAWQASILYTAFSLYRPAYAPVCMRVLNTLYPTINDFRRKGSAALELCEIASGEGELYFEMRVYPWDVAAALCILTEAGGFFTSPVDGRFDFTRPQTLVAANTEASLTRLSDAVRQELFPLSPDFYEL